MERHQWWEIWNETFFSTIEGYFYTNFYSLMLVYPFQSQKLIVRILLSPFLKFCNPTAAGSKCQSGNVPAIATVQSCCQKSPGPGPNMSQNFFLTLSFQKIQTTFPPSTI